MATPTIDEIAELAERIARDLAGNWPPVVLVFNAANESFMVHPAKLDPKSPTNGMYLAGAAICETGVAPEVVYLISAGYRTMRAYGNGTIIEVDVRRPTLLVLRLHWHTRESASRLMDVVMDGDELVDVLPTNVDAWPHYANLITSFVAGFEMHRRTRISVQN